MGSEKAYQVLREIGRKEKGSYGKEISDATSINRSQVAQIITELKSKGLVEKGLRKKAQYYELDPTGCYNQFWELTELKETEGNHVNALKDMIEAFNDDADIEEQMKEEFPQFYALYITNYLHNVEESTIREMLVYDFFKGLLRYDLSAKKVPDWFLFLREFVKQTRMDRTSSEVIFEQVFQSLENKEESFEK